MNRSGNFWVNICTTVLIFAAAIYLIIYFANANSRNNLPAENKSEVASAAGGPEKIATAQSNPEENVSIYYGKQPLYVVFKSGPRIHLVNNEKAQNPTWQQLKDFIESDGTDRETYDLASFPCSAFAEEVHNNAESHGIKAAWVAINFADNAIGHAINAFETTDSGLFYIDCTGDKAVATHTYSDNEKSKIFGNASSCDKVAYVQAGKEYGLISIEAAGQPDYEYYLRHKDTLAKFEADLAVYNNDMQKYNEEVVKFNTWLDGRTIYRNSADHRKATQWNDQLTSQRRALNDTGKYLDKLGDSLGAFWKPKGTVSQVEIYW